MDRPSDESESESTTLQRNGDAAVAATLWEQMSLRERRAQAAAAGMRLSDWEEQQQLQQATIESVDDTGPDEMAQLLHTGFHALSQDNEHDDVATRREPSLGTSSQQPSTLPIVIEQDDDGYDSGTDALSEHAPLTVADTLPMPAPSEAAASDDIMSVAADANDEQQQPAVITQEDDDLLLLLADDTLRRIMLFLEPEDVGRCCTVHRRWHFARDEGLYAALCQRCYARQQRSNLAASAATAAATGGSSSSSSSAPKLNVARWRTWRRMLACRPRLRAGGVYVLKHSHFKTPQVDMFTSWERGQVLECVYFRCLHFALDGTCTYMLQAGGTAREAAAQVWQHRNDRGSNSSSTSSSAGVATGSYTVKRAEVSVSVALPHAVVCFKLLLGSSSGSRGTFTQLDVTEHTSIANDPRATTCHHKVNLSEPFVFTSAYCH